MNAQVHFLAARTNSREKPVDGTAASTESRPEGTDQTAPPVEPQYLAMISLESLVEQYHALAADRLAIARKLHAIKYAIGCIVRESGLKLPYHCAAGTVRKGYASERARNPHKFVLRVRKTCVGRPRRYTILEEK